MKKLSTTVTYRPDILFDEEAIKIKQEPANHYLQLFVFGLMFISNAMLVFSYFQKQDSFFWLFGVVALLVLMGLMWTIIQLRRTLYLNKTIFPIGQLEKVRTENRKNNKVKVAVYLKDGKREKTVVKDSERLTLFFDQLAKAGVEVIKDI